MLAYDFATELTRWITVDDTMTNDRIRTIAIRLTGLGAEDTTFLTAPVSGLVREATSPSSTWMPSAATASGGCSRPTTSQPTYEPVPAPCWATPHRERR